MNATQAELFEALAGIEGLPVLVVGDVILDRYIWGKVDRISPEAPVPVVHVRRTEERLGGAANAVRNLRAVGARVSLCGFIGDDPEGKIILDLLDESGIERDAVMVDPARPTCVKTRVIAHSQQVVRIDQEELREPSPALQKKLSAAVESKLEKSKVVVVSDYGKGVVSEVLLRGLKGAKERGVLGLRSRPLFVDPHPVNNARYSGITVAKPNRREAEIASGVTIVDQRSAVEAGKILLKKWDAEMMVTTLGEDGMVIVSNEFSEGLMLPTVTQEVYDVSGAGDTVTAVFAAAIGAGARIEVAGILSNIAAGIVVSEVGTVSVDLERLKEHVAHFCASRSRGDS